MPLLHVRSVAALAAVGFAACAQGIATIAPPSDEPALVCPDDLLCRTAPVAHASSDTATQAYGNFDVARRGHEEMQIRYIVIHTAEETRETVLRLVRSASFGASAHYLVTAQGEVIQLVHPTDVAWHAGNWFFNMHAIGIEHEAYAAEPGSMSEPMLVASARLVRHLAERYGIPLDRAHIIGHDEVPGPSPKRQAEMHWDPGPYWNWERYMELVGAAPSVEAANGSGANAVVVTPPFARNVQTVTHCRTGSTRDCTRPPTTTNFVYVRKLPASGAPTLNDASVDRAADRLENWTNKVRWGQVFATAGPPGRWQAIFYGGERGWIENDRGLNLTPAKRLLAQARIAGQGVPVYGVAYPSPQAFQPPLRAPVVEAIGVLLPGHQYPVVERVGADYYWAKSAALSRRASSNKWVHDDTIFFRIGFGHRFGFVRETDVDTVGASP